MGESIYSKMFKIDVIIQQITLIIIITFIPLYHIINNFLVVFWGKEKNHYLYYKIYYTILQQQISGSMYESKATLTLKGVL